MTGGQTSFLIRKSDRLMGKAIKLLLVFILLQILGGAAAVPLVLVWQFVTTGTISAYEAGVSTAVPGSLLVMFFTVWYLWKKGYLENDGQIYSPVSAGYLGWTFLAGLSAIMLMEGLMSVLDFLPDWLADTFDRMQGNWGGILYLALLGPVLEELMFRGAITRELLKRYRPAAAIVFSGLLFGLIHFNPVQSVVAFLLGMLLAWLYYRTRSVVPGIVVHVLNNSLSVWFSLTCPDVDHLYEPMGQTAYLVALVLAAVVFALSVWRLARYPKAPDYDSPSVEPVRAGE